jgi:hypothetical protein
METAYLEEWVDLETGGEAVCLARAEASDDPGRREKWLLLAELETRTKSAVMHFLRANGIAVEEKAEKRREGEARARASASLPWSDLMARMQPRLQDYVGELRQFVSASPPAQKEIAARLLEHEEALLAFVERELAGDAHASTAPVRAHLDKWESRSRHGTA